MPRGQKKERRSKLRRNKNKKKCPFGGPGYGQGGGRGLGLGRLIESIREAVGGNWTCSACGEDDIGYGYPCPGCGKMADPSGSESIEEPTED